MIKHAQTYISSWGIGLPEPVITNDEITQKQQLNMRSTTIERMVGVKQRRWAQENQAASDLAVLALNDAKISELHGPLWLSTISSDHWTPNTSSRVKMKMDWHNQFPAVDLNAACAGLIFAVEMAALRLNLTQEQCAVVVASEVRSRFLNPRDRATVYVFGDGAVALELTASPQKALAQIMWTSTHSVPARTIEISVPAGGSAIPITPALLSEGLHCIRIHNGTAIEDKILNGFCQLIVSTLQQAQIQISEYDFFVFHQANRVLLEKLMDRLKINSDRCLSTFEKYGNTSSSSVGINLVEAYRTGRIRAKDRVLCLSMGAGDHFGFMELTILAEFNPGDT